MKQMHKKNIAIFCILLSLFLNSAYNDIYALEDNEIIGQSAILIDKKTGRVLFEKNGYEKKSMASTTKIMTCLLALEQCEGDMSCDVSALASRAPEVKLYLKEDQSFYLEDLLYALMLQSSNDVAVVIAEAVGGSVEDFCDMMTQKAIELGAMDTSFKTPNGLDAEGHYSTAYDLALITRNALNNEKFVEIINTPSYSFNEIETGKAYIVNNKNAFLGMYSGAMGVKTGFTNKAGLCFVGYVKQGDMELISVVLASGWPPNKTYRYKDTIKMMDYGFGNFSYTDIFDDKLEIKLENITYGIEDIVYGECYSDENIILEETETIRKVVDVLPIQEAPINKGDLLGHVNVYINDNLYNTYPINATNDVNRITFKYCLECVLKEFLK